MAKPEHLKMLEQGVEKWNAWRIDCYEEIDLSKADLQGLNLSGADFSYSNLSQAVLYQAKLEGAKLNYAKLFGADLGEAQLIGANMIGANLNGAWLGKANLMRATLENACLDGASLEGAKLKRTQLVRASLVESILVKADLTCADLTEASLNGSDLDGAVLTGAIFTRSYLRFARLTGAKLENANLDYADLTGADLTGADLTLTDLVETNFSRATITGCTIYGISAWNVALDQTVQKDLVISRKDEPVITVDDLAVAQFIYLLLNNKNLRNVLNSVTSKGVLILGRFSEPERKAVLDGLREKLRHLDLLPMVFDFDRPSDKDYTETVQTLAGMSMFVIADLTSPKSTPLELEATVKQFKIPYVPIIDISVDKRPFAMLVDLQRSFHWVLPTLQYETKEALLDEENLRSYIIEPVNKKREELRMAKSNEPEPVLIRKKTTPATAAKD